MELSGIKDKLRDAVLADAPTPRLTTRVSSAAAGVLSLADTRSGHTTAASMKESTCSATIGHPDYCMDETNCVGSSAL